MVMFTRKVIAAAQKIDRLLKQIDGTLAEIYGPSSKAHKDKFTGILATLAMNRYLFEGLKLSEGDQQFLENIFTFEDIFSLENGIDNNIRPSWDEYFMLFAITAAYRSSCHGRRVGSVIVAEKQLLTSGYNGAAKNHRSCQELKKCLKEQKKIELFKSNLGLKQNLLNDLAKTACISECAEATAIKHISEYGIERAKNCTLYATLFPCESCAQKIIASRYIKKVFYKSDYKNKTRKPEDQLQTIELFKANDIEIHQLRIRPEVMRMVIFNLIHPDGVSHELVKPNEFDPESHDLLSLVDIGCAEC